MSRECKVKQCRRLISMCDDQKMKRCAKCARMARKNKVKVLDLFSGHGWGGNK